MFYLRYFWKKSKGSTFVLTHQRKVGFDKLQVLIKTVVLLET